MLEICRETEYEHVGSDSSRFTSTVNVHDAALSGNLQDIKALVIDSNSDIFALNDKEQTALHSAVLGGNKDVIRLLLRVKGANVLQADANELTPLHYAVILGHCEIFLRNLSATVSIRKVLKLTKIQASIFHVAIVMNQSDMVVFMLRYFSHNVLTNSNSLASSTQHDSIFELLMDALCFSPECQQTALCVAAARGQLGVVQSLLNIHHCDAFFKITDGHTTILHCAAMNGHNSVIKYLYNYTDIPDKLDQKECDSLFQLAVQNCNLEIIKIIAEINHCDFNIGLCVACKEGHLNIAKYLIEHCHSDPLSTDEDNNTPLHLAAHSGNLELVKYLSDIYPWDIEQYNNLMPHFYDLHNSTGRITLTSNLPFNSNWNSTQTSLCYPSLNSHSLFISILYSN